MVRNKTISAQVAEAILILVMLLISFMSLAPVVHVFSVSFSDNAAAAGGLVKFWPVGFTLESYRKILEEPHFFNAFLVSVKRVLLGGGINFILTVMMAYPLSRSNKEFRIEPSICGLCYSRCYLPAGLFLYI